MQEQATMGTQHKVGLEVVEADFERFLEAMDLKEKVDAKMDAEDAKSLEELKATVFTAMRRGTLVVDDKGLMAFTPQINWSHGMLTFHEPTGADLMAMDKAKVGHNVARLNALMAALTHTNAGFFANMALRDLRVCQAVTQLFLA